MSYLKYHSTFFSSAPIAEGTAVTSRQIGGGFLLLHPISFEVGSLTPSKSGSCCSDNKDVAEGEDDRVMIKSIREGERSAVYAERHDRSSGLVHFLNSRTLLFFPLLDFFDGFNSRSIFNFAHLRVFNLLNLILILGRRR